MREPTASRPRTTLVLVINAPGKNINTAVCVCGFESMRTPDCVLVEGHFDNVFLLELQHKHFDSRQNRKNKCEGKAKKKKTSF